MNRSRSSARPPLTRRRTLKVARTRRAPISRGWPSYANRGRRRPSDGRLRRRLRRKLLRRGTVRQKCYLLNARVRRTPIHFFYITNRMKRIILLIICREVFLLSAGLARRGIFCLPGVEKRLLERESVPYRQRVVSRKHVLFFVLLCSEVLTIVILLISD